MEPSFQPGLLRRSPPHSRPAFRIPNWVFSSQVTQLLGPTVVFSCGYPTVYPPGMTSVGSIVPPHRDATSRPRAPTGTADTDCRILNIRRGPEFPARLLFLWSRCGGALAQRSLQSGPWTSCSEKAYCEARIGLVSTGLSVRSTSEGCLKCRISSAKTPISQSNDPGAGPPGEYLSLIHI